MQKQLGSNNRFPLTSLLITDPNPFHFFRCISLNLCPCIQLHTYGIGKALILSDLDYQHCSYCVPASNSPWVLFPWNINVIASFSYLKSSQEVSASQDKDQTSSIACMFHQNIFFTQDQLHMWMWWKWKCRPLINIFSEFQHGANNIKLSRGFLN